MKTLKISLALLAILIMLAGLAFSANTAITTKSPTRESLSTAYTGGMTMNDGTQYINYLLWPREQYSLIMIVNVTTVRDIQNTSPSFTIEAGDNPPAFRSDLGDLTVPIRATGVYFMGPLESARFKNKTGYLNMYETNMTANVAIIKEKYS